MPKRVIERTVWAAIVLATASAVRASPGRGNSAATITASFADSCRDFAARSSKDISHVEVHYVDGRVVKDENISRPDHAIDGVAGDEIEFALVKSGTTIEQFDCAPSNHAPAARLEIQTPPVDQVPGPGHCWDFFTGSGGGLLCEQSGPRTAWTRPSETPDPDGSETLLLWGCGAFTASCPFTFIFRGTGSSDADGDLTSWSLDFGDGTSASGSWSTAPPEEVTHEYLRDAAGSFNCFGVFDGVNNVCVVTLTVTDAAGQSASDVIGMLFLDQSPD
jgi:hypothetical protein